MINCPQDWNGVFPLKYQNVERGKMSLGHECQIKRNHTTAYMYNTKTATWEFPIKVQESYQKIPIQIIQILQFKY